ncbi:aldo/keto reductase [Tetragenococcus halophilus]|mgnify:FL=1|uniref:Aldo/keto reductase n=3 Tax=Tetragenococcus halophilus TaxID=51669 RepID=A0A3G5FJW7_TETHA|nr:aldo/keto reductase [Tetragenococcus halophilus]AOF48940.1 aldo/keto reductase [Tetragenococcus halophilus]AYW50545.1 aldo/keto reductase [Tetragenococcus halophilus]MCO7026324.1 aldo/keto reductase [Tetragenococcus halophilus]MCO8284037.1 aldo/keto reductase [Tetragenococcus halophilus]MCO8285569.1 aldo/keto reductase [Tetragenococcus halophilus]
MKQLKFGSTGIEVPSVILGCMRMNSATEPEKVLQTAVEHGITFFDHADIYGSGECEQVFANSLAKTSIKREDLFIQSKCGIVPGEMYDFSKEHIIQAVNGSLKRLQTDYLDALLLHRPDTLMEPEEVAAAFDELATQGKVRHFGVSNHNPMQIKLLQKTVKQPLEANQLQFGLMHTGMIDEGLYVNRKETQASERDGEILEFSRLKNMTIQAWSPYQASSVKEVFINNDRFPELNQKLAELAEKYHTTPNGLASAWVLRHPANMQIIAGTMNSKRIEEIAQASEIQLSRKDWYQLYLSAGNGLP